MGLLNFLSLPFKGAGRVGRAVEMAVPTLFHPEQILSKSEPLRLLYEGTVKQTRLSRLAAEGFKTDAAAIAKKYGLNSEQQMNEFLTFLEFPTHMKRFPTAGEMAQFSPEVKMATVEHLQKITDPIHVLAAESNPNLGYVPGYFTHFPIKSYRNFLDDEIGRVSKLLSEVNKEDANYFNYRHHLSQLRGQLDKVSHVDDSLNSVRYQQLPTGTRFGPLDESRKMQELWGYKRDYKEVMNEYVDGAMRKIFLDQYMPFAKNLIEQEPNMALKQYAFDYVTAQRGALGAKRRIYLNESIAQLFPNPEAGYKGVANAVDYATRFQYLTKIGLSWFRFPFVNATQPLLTTYPMVGGKNLILGYLEAFSNPKIWKEAKDVGVIFEADLRKGLTEAIGAGTKLFKAEKMLSWPAQFSEQINRVVSYAAGKIQGKERGLIGEALTDHAINLVNRTQFLYHKEGLPLIMSASPAGRLIFQFRTFTANYVNFLTQLVRNKQYPELARAMGSLMTLAGSSAIPFSLWDSTRRGVLRNAGVDIGDFNPVEWSTERMGISPPVNFGASLEPFNIPTDVSQIFGPTAGPIIQTLTKLFTRPEEADETLRIFFEGISPPVTRLIRGAMGPEARTDPTKTHRMGRVIGERGATEVMFMRPTTEATRRKYIELIANAYAGGRPDLAGQLRIKGQRLGLRLDREDMKQAKARATKLKGVEEIEPSEMVELTPAPITRPRITEIIPRR